MGTITVKATYDGVSFKIQDPVDLEPNTEYILTIEKEDSKKSENAIDFLIRNAGTISGPSDFSEEHDHYLYGTPKKGKQREWDQFLLIHHLLLQCLHRKTGIIIKHERYLMIFLIIKEYGLQMLLSMKLETVFQKPIKKLLLSSFEIATILNKYT